MPSTTINYSVADGTALAWAFGRKLGLGQDASAAQIKADFIAYAKSVYRDQKRLEAGESNIPAELDLT